MATKAADQITIVDLTDAYSIMLSMDAISLNGAVSNLGTQQTATINVSAYRGAEKLTPTIGTITSSDTNVTTSIGSASNQTIPITVTFKAALAAGGKLTIPVTVETVTINKEFSWSVSFKGNPGSNGTSVTITKIEYNTSTTETQPSSGWSTTFPGTVAEGSWLWTKVTYSDSKTVITKAKQGKSGSNGAPGTSSYTHIKYSTKADGTNFVDTPTDATIYIGVYSGTSATAPTGKGSYKWSRYTGKDGDDAITMVVTSSGGTIFKNTAIATTLTAHVYKAGVELTEDQIAALGTVNWYKDGGTTADSTGVTKSISAGDVTNKAIFEARLEA